MKKKTMEPESLVDPNLNCPLLVLPQHAVNLVMFYDVQIYL